MEYLNKEALSIFFDNVATPLLKEYSEKLDEIDKKMFYFEDTIYQLPFMERRNLYMLEKIITEKYGQIEMGNENKSITKKFSSEEEFNIIFKVQGKEVEIERTISTSLLSLTV